MFSYRDSDNVERTFLFMAAVGLIILLGTIAYGLLYI